MLVNAPRFAKHFGAGVRRQSLLAAIDHGTSSSRVILYDQTLTPVAKHQIEIPTKTPHAGWAQMDPMLILSSVEESAAGALKKAGATAKDVLGVGITNHRESTVVWDKRTGKPLYDCVLWHDARTMETSNALKQKLGGQDALRSISGLPISSYFSGVKLRWLIDNVPDVRSGFERGTALFGTVDTWLAWNLTAGAGANPTHITDVTNASRTMMMNLESTEWSSEAIDALGLGLTTGGLPEIISSAEAMGIVRNGGALHGVALTSMLGDQQSAMVGQRCFSVGDAKTTYGSGAFLLMNAGTKPVRSTHGLLSTALYKFGSWGPTHYAMEGAIASCAVGINWFRDNLKMLREAPEISHLAGQVETTDGLFFVPAFGGLLAPHWRDDARATLVGLTLAHDRRHVSRAVLEGIAFQVKEVVDAMAADTGTRLSTMRVDGGVSQSDPLLQYQADLLGVQVQRPANVETTALGAGIGAGLGAGLWNSLEDLSTSGGQIERSYMPSISEAAREEQCAAWSKAIAASTGWGHTQ